MPLEYPPLPSGAWPTLSLDMMVPFAIAAVLIGGTSLFGGVGRVSGTLIGAIILTLVLNGMNLLTISANWQPLVTGVIVVLAVFFDTLSRRKSGTR